MHGDEVPASYANFYIANTAVIVPVFDLPEDQIAIDTLSRLFPDRELIPINCREIVWGLGAIHCLCCPMPAVGGSRSLPAYDFGKHQGCYNRSVGFDHMRRAIRRKLLPGDLLVWLGT